MRGVVKKNAAVFAENLVFVSSAPRELLKKKIPLSPAKRIWFPLLVSRGTCSRSMYSHQQTHIHKLK